MYVMRYSLISQRYPLWCYQRGMVLATPDGTCHSRPGVDLTDVGFGREYNDHIEWTNEDRITVC